MTLTPGSGMPKNAVGMFASATTAVRRISGVGLGLLAFVALGAIPTANAGPPGCPQGPAPGPGPGCGLRAFVSDIAAAGLENSNGSTVELDQGLDMCGLMDAGLSSQNMVGQLAAINPSLSPDQAALVVGIAIRDLCPWHR